MRGPWRERAERAKLRDAEAADSIEQAAKARGAATEAIRLAYIHAELTVRDRITGRPPGV